MRIADPLQSDLAGLTMVCFVCTGNICRSPIAEFVFERRAKEAGIERQVGVCSAGTGAWHIGQHADARAELALEQHDIDGRSHRARLFNPQWFANLDYVIALDRGHELELETLAPTLEDRNKVYLLRSFDAGSPDRSEVPDPYYENQRAFNDVFEMVDRAIGGLIDDILARQTPTQD